MSEEEFIWKSIRIALAGSELNCVVVQEKDERWATSIFDSRNYGELWESFGHLSQLEALQCLLSKFIQAGAARIAHMP